MELSHLVETFKKFLVRIFGFYWKKNFKVEFIIIIIFLIIIIWF